MRKNMKITNGELRKPENDKITKEKIKAALIVDKINCALKSYLSLSFTSLNSLWNRSIGVIYKIRNELNKKLYSLISSNETTLDDLFEKYTSHCTNSELLNANTIRRYSDEYERIFSETSLKSMDIKRIDALTIETEIKKAIKELHLHRESINKIMALLNGMFKFALSNGYLEIYLFKNTRKNLLEYCSSTK